MSFFRKHAVFKETKKKRINYTDYKVLIEIHPHVYGNLLKEATKFNVQTKLKYLNANGCLH
jgi:hypothetical protein